MMAPVHDSDISELDPDPVGPKPSFIQVAKPYIFEHTIQECIRSAAVSQAREDQLRLSGVQWIESVRKALKLPVRTFDTAVIYYHKFRLVHADTEYNHVDAAAAALFTACKIEDTLKKSRDIICAAHNLRLPVNEQLSPDDNTFEVHSRAIIGLERLMLEASSFDFRHRHPQQLLVKLAKHYPIDRNSRLAKTAYRVSLDVYRTFAPLKQTTATLAFACLELSGRLLNQHHEIIESGKDYTRWRISRAMVMETMLDLLELYTHHRSNTVIGPEFPLDIFLQVRIPLNQEMDTKQLPRFTEWKDDRIDKRDKHDHHSKRKSLTNGVSKPSNVTKTSSKEPSVIGNSLASPSVAPPVTINGTTSRTGDTGREGTVRFMLNPQRERDERAVVAEYLRPPDADERDEG